MDADPQLLDRITAACTTAGIGVARGDDGRSLRAQDEGVDLTITLDPMGAVVRHAMHIPDDVFGWAIPGSPSMPMPTAEDVVARVVESRWGPLSAEVRRAESGHDVVLECLLDTEVMTRASLRAALHEVAKTRRVLDRLIADDRAQRAAIADLMPPAALAAPPVPSAPAWLPTHRVPAEGMPTWPAPDPSSPQGPRLDARLTVQVVEHRGDWARIVCSNGWSTWVDARTLQSVTS
ncbi:MAG TPA: hypothetical protein VG266_00445 [Candidatus Dormibacteraeota bacterium]|jgi:hypothetical protein|nr:hypothetical protein [Candidatus Dormibacteraeota bacterium]